MWINHHVQTYLYLKKYILYHANKYFVTNVNVELEVEGVHGNFPFIHPCTAMKKSLKGFGL